MLAGFALLGDVIVTAGPSTLWRPEGSWWHSMTVWFVAAFVLHDLLLFPIYALADRVLGFSVARLPSRRREAAVSVRNYLRAPALGCGLLFLIFFPGIIRQGAALYYEDTGLTQEPFLALWLRLTAIMFAGSAVCYSVRIAVGRWKHANPQREATSGTR